MAVTDLVGGAAVATSLVYVWPQVARLVRTRDPDGISVRGAAWTCTAFALWVAYGTDKALVPVWAANGQALLGFGIVAALAHRWGPRTPGLVPIVVGLAGGVIALGVLAPAPVIGVVAAVLGSTAFLPQAWVTLHVDDLSGVSVATYSLISLTSLLFLLYGSLRHDVILLSPNIVTVPAAALVAIRAARSHRATPAATPTESAAASEPVT